MASLKEGTSVSLGRATPPAYCKPIGYLIGRGGGSLGGDLLSNNRLTELAMNDLRNQAAKVGANYVQHDPPSMGQADGNTTTVTISGTAYQCRRPEADETTASAQKSEQPRPPDSRPQDSPPPDGAAGFRFGSTVAEANAACKHADGEWEPQTSTRFLCSDSETGIGIEASALLRFCDGLLCELQLNFQKSAASSFDKLGSQLRKRYGEPRQSAEPGSASGQKLRWWWSTGERVTLSRINDSDGEPVLISVYYSKSQVEPRSSGL